MYGERKRWPLEGVQVRLTHSRIYAEDCATFEEGMLDRIDRDILVAGDLSDEQRQRLLEIGARCPVHRTLVPEIQISTRVTMADVQPTGKAK